MCICICDAGRLDAALEVNGACMVRVDCTSMLFIALVLYLLRLYLLRLYLLRRHLGDALEVPRLVTLVLYLLRLYLLRHLGDALEVPRLVALVYLLDAEDAPGLHRVK